MPNNYGLEGALTRRIDEVIFEQTTVAIPGEYGPGEIILSLGSAEQLAEFGELVMGNPSVRVKISTNGNSVVYKFATIENIGSGFVNEDYDISTYPDEIPTYFVGGRPEGTTMFLWWDVSGNEQYSVEFQTLLVPGQTATLKAYIPGEEKSIIPNYNFEPSDYHVNNNIAANFGPGINIMDAMDKAMGLPGVQEIAVEVGPIVIPESKGGDTPDNDTQDEPGSNASEESNS